VATEVIIFTVRIENVDYYHGIDANKTAIDIISPGPLRVHRYIESEDALAERLYNIYARFDNNLIMPLVLYLGVYDKPQNFSHLNITIVRAEQAVKLFERL
jgi:hypothetical protein